MNAFIPKIMLCVMLVLILTGAGEAQDQTGVVSVQASFKKLEEQLSFAKELLASFPNRQAQQLIQKAQQLRDQARAASLRNRPVMALSNLRAAQLMIDQAVGMLIMVPLDRLKERLQELLRRAERVVPVSGNKEAERLLRMAQQNRQFGNRNTTLGDYRKTMEYYRVATFLAERAIDLAEGPKGNLQDRLQKEKERFEELLDRARFAVLTGKDEKAIKLLGKAEHQVGSIKDAINRGDFQLALSLYYSTTRLLLRVIDISEGKHVSAREQAIEEVEVLIELINMVKDRFQESKNKRIIFLIDRAEKLYFKAQNDIESDRYLLALQKIERARGLLNRIKSGRPGDGSGLLERAERELERLQEDISRIENKSESVEETLVKQYLSAAELCVKDAEKWISTGSTRLALETILAGNRFVLAAERATKAARKTQPEIVRRELEKLERVLSDAKSEPESRSEIATGLVRQAEEMRNRALAALEKGQTQLAMDYTKIALDLVMKSRRQED